MKNPESRTSSLASMDVPTPNYPRGVKKVMERYRPPVAFAEAVRDRPQAFETTLAYQNPYTDK
jgi:hypothetical protein